MTRVAALMAGVITGALDPARTREDVRQLAAVFPPYPR
ncbi:serine hydroxymethyltransferase [Streptomyces hirsutus]